MELARGVRACFTARVKLPYKIATLLYCFNERDEILLLERAQEPNRGLWSPCGGKLHTEEGESPYDCAAREAHEELGVKLLPTDFHLAGIVSEHGFQGQTHWLMFLFELKLKLKALPPPMSEGRFQFFPRAALESLPSRKQIANVSGRGFGNIAAASLPHTVIATRMVGTTGRWKKRAHRNVVGKGIWLAGARRFPHRNLT